MPVDRRNPKRRIIPDPSGKRGRDFMSEKGTGVATGKINKGQETAIPTIFKGKRISAEKAAHIIHQHGGIDPENPQRGKIKTTAGQKKAGRDLSRNPSARMREDFLKAQLKGRSFGKPKSKRSRK